MKGACKGCGNPDPWAMHYKKEALTGKRFQECNKCFDASIPDRPDVYFRNPYWDSNLHDIDDVSYDKEKGTFVQSRKHKAYLFKKLGVRESGDRVHGASGYDPVYARVARRNFEKNIGRNHV